MITNRAGYCRQWPSTFHQELFRPPAAVFFLNYLMACLLSISVITSHDSFIKKGGVGLLILFCQDLQHNEVGQPKD